MDWLEGMKAALERIESSMEQPLDVAEIAGVAYTSPFHFQRMFHMLTGFTLAEYVRKRKLTLAAQELASSSAKVLVVALKYGYDTPESFAKAFRKAHGIAPSAARVPGVRLKAFPRITFHISLKGDKDMDYRIVEKAEFTLAGKKRRVTTRDGENLRQIPAFWSECTADGTVDLLIATFEGRDLLGICTDMSHEDEEFTYVIGVEAETVGGLDGLTMHSIPAATWAVFTSVGPLPRAIQSLWERIFQEWFPATGYVHAEGPELEVYPAGDTTADDYRCEVWVPIVKK